MGDMRFMFFIIVLVSIPIIVIYKTGDSLNYNLEVKSKYGQWSIANMGYDSVHCTMIPFGI
jgi:hypothetical protein